MKRNAVILSIPVILITTLVISCDPFFNCLEGDGVLQKETRVVSKFYGVENTTSFDVDVDYDSITSVTVFADENLLPYIRTYVNGGTLVVSTEGNRCIKNNTPVSIKITMPLIEMIDLSGSGNITANNFKSSSLDVTNSGSGNIDMTNFIISDLLNLDLSGSGTIIVDGKSSRAKYNLSGSGDIIADDMLTGDCSVSSSGSGDVRCFAYDTLEVFLSGSGDVIYSGSPQVTTHVTGSGRVRH